MNSLNIHKSAGFTIVELVSVMMVIGVLSAIAAPKFIGSDAFEARGAYSTLVSALRHGQKTAIANRSNVYVNINAATRDVCVGFTTDCGTPAIDPNTRASYFKTLSNKVNITTSASIVGFDGMGRPIPNADVTIQINNAVTVSETPRVITVEAETGYVR